MVLIKNQRSVQETFGVGYLRLKSWEDAHFFLSSADKFCCFLIDLLHPAVIVPNLVNARRIIGELGTLLALYKPCARTSIVFGRMSISSHESTDLGVSMSGTCKKLLLLAFCCC